MVTQVTPSDPDPFWPKWLRLGPLWVCVDAAWPAKGYRRLNLSIDWDGQGSGFNAVVQPWWGYLHFQAAWISKGESK